jgi:hypothetical protein
MEGAMSKRTIVVGAVNPKHLPVTEGVLVVVWRGENDYVRFDQYPVTTDFVNLPHTTIAVWNVRKWPFLCMPVAAVLMQAAGLPVPLGVEVDMLIGPLPKQSRKQPAGVPHDRTMPTHRYIQHGYSEQNLCGRCGMGEGHSIHSFPLKRGK